MGRFDPSRVLGTTPRAAALQAAGVFALARPLALVRTASDPRRTPELLITAAADVTAAAVTRALPWQRWAPYAPAVLAVPAFVILGFSTWVFGGVVAGT